jgi:hypothetical protein
MLWMRALAADKAKQLISFLAHLHAKHVIHNATQPVSRLHTRPAGR